MIEAAPKTGFSIPTPPTANKIWRKGKGGRIHKSQEYVSWLNDAGILVKAQKPTPLKDPARVEVRIYMVRPRKNADIDNRIKPILDLMQHLEIIKNDSLVHRVSAEWISRKQGWPDCFVFYEEMQGEAA